MPRAKKIEYDEPQRYDIGNGVRVTVEWPKGSRPKMQHLDTVVIIGDHACAARPVAPIDPCFDVVAHRAPAKATARGGNFEVDEDDPAYLAFKARLGQGVEAAAPPDVSPPVITSEDILRSTPGFEHVDLRALIQSAPPLPTGTEGG